MIWLEQSLRSQPKARGRIAAALVFAVLAVVARAGAESVPAVDLNPAVAGSPEASYDGMIGWTFYLTQPVVLHGLCLDDDGLDGLAHPHQIGIWKDQSGRTDGPYMDLLNAANTSALVLSATIPREWPLRWTAHGVVLTSTSR